MSEPVQTEDAAKIHLQAEIAVELETPSGKPSGRAKSNPISAASAISSCSPAATRRARPGRSLREARNFQSENDADVSQLRRQTKTWCVVNKSTCPVLIISDLSAL